jgi:hypothetical protein
MSTPSLFRVAISLCPCYLSASTKISSNIYSTSRLSRISEFVSFDDLVTVYAARDATLSESLSRFHNGISRGVVAFKLTVHWQTLGEKDGNMPEQFTQEWFVDLRLPPSRGWFKPTTVIGFWSTTGIVTWVGKEVEKRLSEADFEVPEMRWSAHVHCYCRPPKSLKRVS